VAGSLALPPLVSKFVKIA